MKVCPKCGTQYGDDANFCTADAGRLVAMAAAPAPAPAASGLLGGRFQLGPRLAGGDSGAVHRATDTQTGATVAVKLIAPAVLTPAAQGQRVERELKLLERVKSSQIAQVLASGKQGDQLWVASEWVEGGLPLNAQVEAGIIDVDRATELVAAIGAALLDAAKVGLVHRDLAPQNVLVAGDQVKLINFAVPTPGERVPGVPAFVSPEAIEGKPIDQRSTTYSLGALTYFLLTGQPPFAGDAPAIHAAHLAGAVPPPSSLAHIAPAFDAVIGRAMDRNPARRYLTLKQFLDDVAKAAAGGPDPSTTAPFGRVGKRESVPAPSRAP
ncbi:MAG TPA: serine/threonine-protein kinase, partial [Kofleriaceae bacterium]|nr:serine/threonine-protein kinase [Kofleriaceae bacterium]